MSDEPKLYTAEEVQAIIDQSCLTVIGACYDICQKNRGYLNVGDMMLKALGVELVPVEVLEKEKKKSTLKVIK